MTTRNPLEYSLLFLAAFLWAVAFPLIKVAVDTIPPAHIAAGRAILGAAILLSVITISGARLTGLRGEGRKILALGVLGFALPFFLQNTAELWVPSRDAAILIALTPLFIVIFARLLVPEESITPQRILGLAFGFMGVLVLVELTPTKDIFQSKAALGHLLLLIAAMSYAGNVILARTVTKIPPLQMTFYALAWASSMTIALALSTEQVSPAEISTESMIAVLLLGIGSTAAATFLTYRLVRTLGPGAIAQAIYLVPPIGVLIGKFMLGEAITPNILWAMGLILLGLALAEGRLKILRRTKPAG